MKKVIIIVILLMNIVNVEASYHTPTYSIIANSNSQEDVEQLYKIKNELLNDYSIWVKGVDDIYTVLIDHQYVYDAIYKNGNYEIILGKGTGKKITGTLEINYCSTTTDIKKTSWILSLFN